MEATKARRPRTATPERWQAALQRAIDAGVQVRQVRTTGQWVATSASDAAAAHEIAVVGGVARACSCPAGEHGDEICLHRAKLYQVLGLLDLAPEHPGVVFCPGCHRRGVVLQNKPVPAGWRCPRCREAGGPAPAPAGALDPRAAALLAA